MPCPLPSPQATLNSDFAKGGGKGKGKAKGGPAGLAPPPRVSFPPLGSIKWHRLICDEAHTVSAGCGAVSEWGCGAGGEWDCGAGGGWEGPPGLLRKGPAWHRLTCDEASR